jgi:hypothetical protein
MAKASIRNGGAWTEITDESHRADTADAHDASAISFTPAGTIAATDVQAAIEEVAAEAGGGGSLTVEDEGTPLATAATTLDFVGAGVTATGAGAEKTITIPGSAAHEADGTDAHDASAISVLDTGGNFTGTDVETVLAELAGASSGTVDIEDEGAAEGAADTIDFTGAGVSVSFAAGKATVDIPGGGGGGATIQYPGLKPATPTYDFDDAALHADFTVNSQNGAFSSSHVKTQGEDWVGSSVELQYSAQMGSIHVAHANTDLDFHVGGIRQHGALINSSSMMMGIAALNSSGTGVGVVIYDDNNIYLATITNWEYSANSDNWGNKGMRQYESNGDWWLRLKRVSGTWTGYASQSGRAWDKTFNTRADSITVDRLVFGLLYQKAVGYSGRITADYFQVDV